MGGFGSGKWRSPDRKSTVDRCLSINVSDFPKNICDCVSGELRWENRFTGKEIASVGYLQLPESKSEPMLILSYEHGNRALNEHVSFQKTKPHFGGVRWWFTCPICERRVGKIYLPPESEYFACRHCYNLTYRSSQCSKRYKGLYSMIANKVGVDPAIINQLLK